MIKALLFAFELFRCSLALTLKCEVNLLINISFRTESLAFQRKAFQYFRDSVDNCYFSNDTFFY